MVVWLGRGAKASPSAGGLLGGSDWPKPWAVADESGISGGPAGGRALLWGGLLLGVGVAALLWWRGDPPEATPVAAPAQEHGRLVLAGLEGTVRIDRNRHGVPQIRARSERDAFFALGFSHAQDRLGQLLRLRRAAQGRAAAVEGPERLDGDRVARLLDFPGLAEAQWPKLPRRARGVLEAYAAGVNARLERVGRLDPGLPPGSEPVEPWRPQDSLALFKRFAWSLGDSVELSLVLHELVALLGAQEADRFFPPRSHGPPGPGRSTAAAPAGGARPAAVTGASGSGEAPWLRRGLSQLRRSSGFDGYGVGSSAFVLGGEHTESGAPLLLADSHSAPRVPAAFHLAHLRAPGLDVAGLSLPASRCSGAAATASWPGPTSTRARW